MIGGVFVACLLAGLLASAPQWRVGSNLFVPNERNLERVYRATLPAYVLETFVAEYARANPQIACDRAAQLPWRTPAPCWHDLAIRGGPFAESADAMFGGTAEGRPARALDIGPGRPLSAGFLFDARYVWHITSENPNMPPHAWYVAVRVIPELVGSRLCWSGTLAWEKRAVAERSPAGGTCRELAAGDSGDRLWALQATALAPLALRLEPSAMLRFRLVLHDLLLLGSTLLILACALRFGSMPWQHPAILAASFALLYAAAPHFLGGLPGHALNRDALLYLSWGRDIALDLVRGDLAQALRGGESIYLFMPGMRYFLALESFLFGDSGYGHVLCIVFLPLVIYLVTREITARDSLFVALVVLTAAMLVKAVRTAADGYSDPLGMLLIGVAALLFMRRADTLVRADGLRRPDAGIAAGFLLLGAAIFVRPNFVLAGALITLLWLWLRARGALLSLWPLEALGLLLVLAMPAHNLAFGHQFLPMTLASTLPDALTAPPAAYLGAVTELLGFAPGENTQLVARKLSSWLLPVKWILFSGTLLLALHPTLASRKLRLLAAICFALQLPHLFYRAGAREMMAANYFSLLAVLGAAWQIWVRRRSYTAGRK